MATVRVTVRDRRPSEADYSPVTAAMSIDELAATHNYTQQTLEPSMAGSGSTTGTFEGGALISPHSGDYDQDHIDRMKEGFEPLDGTQRLWAGHYFGRIRKGSKDRHPIHGCYVSLGMEESYVAFSEMNSYTLPLLILLSISSVALDPGEVHHILRWVTVPLVITAIVVQFFRPSRELPCENMRLPAHSFYRRAVVCDVLIALLWCWYVITRLVAPTELYSGRVVPKEDHPSGVVYRPFAYIELMVLLPIAGHIRRLQAVAMMVFTVVMCFVLTYTNDRFTGTYSGRELAGYSVILVVMALLVGLMMHMSEGRMRRRFRGYVAALEAILQIQDIVREVRDVLRNAVVLPAVSFTASHEAVPRPQQRTSSSPSFGPRSSPPSLHTQAAHPPAAEQHQQQEQHTSATTQTIGEDLSVPAPCLTIDPATNGENIDPPSLPSSVSLSDLSGGLRSGTTTYAGFVVMTFRFPPRAASSRGDAARLQFLREFLRYAYAEAPRFGANVAEITADCIGFVVVAPVPAVVDVLEAASRAAADAAEVAERSCLLALAGVRWLSLLKDFAELRADDADSEGNVEKVPLWCDIADRSSVFAGADIGQLYTAVCPPNAVQFAGAPRDTAYRIAKAAKNVACVAVSVPLREVLGGHIGLSFGNGPNIVEDEMAAPLSVYRLDWADSEEYLPHEAYDEAPLTMEANGHGPAPRTGNPLQSALSGTVVQVIGSVPWESAADVRLEVESVRPPPPEQGMVPKDPLESDAESKANQEALQEALDRVRVPRTRWTRFVNPEVQKAYDAWAPRNVAERHKAPLFVALLCAMAVAASLIGSAEQWSVARIVVAVCGMLFLGVLFVIVVRTEHASHASRIGVFVLCQLSIGFPVLLAHYSASALDILLQQLTAVILMFVTAAGQARTPFCLAGAAFAGICALVATTVQEEVVEHGGEEQSSVTRYVLPVLWFSGAAVVVLCEEWSVLAEFRAFWAARQCCVNLETEFRHAYDQLQHAAPPSVARMLVNRDEALLCTTTAAAIVVLRPVPEPPLPTTSYRPVSTVVSPTSAASSTSSRAELRVLRQLNSRSGGRMFWMRYYAGGFIGIANFCTETDASLRRLAIADMPQLRQLAEDALIALHKESGADEPLWRGAVLGRGPLAGAMVGAAGRACFVANGEALEQTAEAALRVDPGKLLLRVTLSGAAETHSVINK